MSSTQSQRQTIALFRDTTNCSEASAQKYLKATRYNLEAAVDMYLRKHTAPASRIDTKQLEKIFNSYADSTNKEEITIDGTIAYLNELGIDLEEIGVLALAMQLDAPTQGTFTKVGFIRGWSALGISSLEGMKGHAKTLTETLSRDRGDFFKKTYLHTFTFALTAPSRTLPLESALVFWDLLLTDRFDRLGAWKEFLAIKGRGVSRDVWNLLLEFSVQVKDLQDYNEMEAWPVVIDDFVAWCKENNK